MSNPTIQCLSIIGPDNSLLYIKKYLSGSDLNDETDLEMDLAVYSALEFMPQAKTFSQFKRFFGLINPNLNDKYNCYGYKAPLGYKIVVLILNVQNQPNQSNILNLCEKVKEELFHSFRNPFYTPFSPITSPSLTDHIDKLVKNLNVD